MNNLNQNPTANPEPTSTPRAPSRPNPFFNHQGRRSSFQPQILRPSVPTSSKRVSLQPVRRLLRPETDFSPVFKPNFATPDTVFNTPTPEELSSNFATTVDSYAENILRREEQLNDPDLSVAETYEKLIREKDEIIDNQNREISTVKNHLKTTQGFLKRSNEQVRDHMVSDREQARKHRKLEEVIETREHQIHHNNRDSEEQQALFRVCKKDLEKNKNRVTKLANGLVDLSYMLQLRNIGHVSIQEVRKEHVGFVKWIFKGNEYNLNGNNDRALGVALDRNDDEIMSGSLDDMSTDASVSQFSLRDNTGFDYATCSQHLPGIMRLVDDDFAGNTRYNCEPPKKLTANASTLTDISVSDPWVEKVSLIGFNETVRPRVRVSAFLKSEPNAERSNLTQ